jgi:twinkle protein
MSIVQNVPCAECQATGHDRTGNHMIVFADGSRFCNRSHFHKSGKTAFVPSDGTDPILKEAVTGNFKYTTEQFKTLLADGKLSTPALRAIALSGMRQKDSWEIMTTQERAIIERDWEHDAAFFEQLKTKNLVSRGIKGNIAKFYGVRVGLDANGNTDRHYYPRFDNQGNWLGAKCRTLPKEFGRGTLGKMWGGGLMFGQQTLQSVLELGRRKDVLILTGGELDAMAAQQMLLEAQDGTKYAGQFYHIWSPFKGEMCIQEILDQKEEILQFKKILLCFDNDEVGQKLTRDVARIFRDKAMKIHLPNGCKDANDCLLKGQAKQFVDAYWNPVEVFSGGQLKRVSELVKKALVQPVMGKSWPFPDLNPLTFGIRPHTLVVIGAGTGVGKTETTKEICFHLIEQYGETVAVIYLEEQPEKTVRSYAGKLINKRIEEPAITDKTNPDYSAEYDYTPEEAEEAILKLETMDKLIIADTKGDKCLDNIMGLLEELVALGITTIVLDNLTAIELPKNQSGVTAIDEAMKRIGSFKDEKPVTIILLSHLNRPKDPRKPHEMGGEVHITDFRGSGSISFWANVIIGIERNTYGQSDEEKRLTTYRIVKCRDRGVSVGRIVRASMSPTTGRLLQAKSHAPYTPPAEPKVAEGEVTEPNPNEEF